jgi:hypothetical protein
MATMIYVTAYQRNWGKMSDDPQMALSYESQYQALKTSALSEENRKKMEGAALSISFSFSYSDTGVMA